MIELQTKARAIRVVLAGMACLLVSCASGQQPTSTDPGREDLDERPFDSGVGPAGEGHDSSDAATLAALPFPAQYPQAMVLDAATMSPLGFSPEQAAKAFAGQYEAALTYYDGHPPSTLRVSIHPNGKPLSRFGAPPGIPDGTSYAFRESGGRGALETRGVSEGSSVVLSVDLEFSSEDGRFHEQLQTELRAFDLDFARLEPELALAGESGPGEEDYEISGSFSFDPEGFRSAGVGLYIDVHRDDDSGSTSGWVGNTRRDPSVPDAEPEMYDFAVWGECSLNRLDAGTAACADGGLPVSADGQARAKED